MSARLRSTSARLALVVTVAFLAACVLLGAGVYYAVSTLLLDDAREVIAADRAGLVALWHDEGPAALRAEIAGRVDGDPDGDAVYALLANDGRVLAGNFARMPATSARARWLQFPEVREGERLRVLASVDALPDGTRLFTGLRLRSQDRFLALMLRAALTALLVAATLGVLIGWLTSRWVSARLRSLDATAARIGAGELGLRAPLDGSDDAFDRLARRFNAMLERIQELLDGVRHATDHIAHDLRTPLTRLRNRLEALRGVHPAGASLDAAIAETDQLLQSFGALLRLARIEAQQPDPDAPVVDIAALAGDAAELYLPNAQARGVSLRCTLQPAPVAGDADQLFQLVVNLLDNALKFSPAAGEVELRVFSADGEAVLEVADRGPGIPEADRERVFDRFQRLETHRGSAGTGLGLSLVRAIARRHGGRVALLDHAPGLLVQVRLPLRPG
jgi:signal transduction histidine kinase